MKVSRIPLIVKVIAYQITFLVIHFLYEWFPGTVTQLISATSESMFQHMKAVFFSYILLTAVECVLTRDALPRFPRYFYSRLLGAVLMPLLMNVFYFSAAAYVGKLPSVLLEVVFANGVLLVLSTTTFHLEEYFIQAEPARPLKWMLVILFILTASEIIIFNYHLPWFDVFAIPPGWE